MGKETRPKCENRRKVGSARGKVPDQNAKTEERSGPHGERNPTKMRKTKKGRVRKGKETRPKGENRRKVGSARGKRPDQKAKIEERSGKRNIWCFILYKKGIKHVAKANTNERSNYEI